MKTMKSLLFLFLGVLPSQVQEFFDWEFTAMESTRNNVVTPIDVTMETSTVRMQYDFNRLSENISPNEVVARLTFKGYNPGEAQTRRIKVWLSNRWSNNPKCVFDADCIIPHGGSVEENITLLDLPFDEPYTYQGEEHTIITIESTGMLAEQPLVFELQDGRPVVTISARAETACFNGTVKDQDGNAVQDACVNLHHQDPYDESGVLTYTTHTDSEGGYAVRLEHGSRSYCLSVSASGFPDYLVDWPFQLYGDVLPSAPSGDIIMTNRLDFRSGQQATIILPEAPDPSWGRYYRLDQRNDDGVIIFVREGTPQANVPYVIFPEDDFSIDLSGYVNEEMPEAGSLLFPDSDEDTPLGLFGTYQSRFAYSMYATYHVSLLDSTPDCQMGTSGNLPRVGAFRAYIVGYNTGSMYDDKLKLIFVEESDDISEVPVAKAQEKLLFDLQGRRMNGIPQKGVYIQNGRKYVK